MNDYISRQDALNEMAEAECGLEYEKCTDCTCQYIGRIRDIPTADVVDVVRCKDCKWFNNIGCAIKIVDDSDKPKDNDYCSFGERTDT